MARTNLFTRLSDLVRRNALAEQHGTLAPPELSALCVETRMARRGFMERALLGLGAVAAARLSTACGESSDGEGAPDDVRIAIVGAGIAGLHCVYRLEKAGVTATLYEASSRVGGRMFTDRESFGEQVAELGGEFVDSGHLTIRMLAEELGIQLDDLGTAQREGVVDELWWVGGRAVPDTTIVEQFKQVAPLMADLLEQAEGEDPAIFAMLDNLSMQDWLDENLKDQPELKSVLESAYRGEYGRELNEQSVLNLIYLIGSDDPDPFRIFGVSDERYHAHTGSQSFPDKIAETLESPIVLAHELVRAKKDGGAYVLTFRTPDGEKEVAADHVVFALPFTMLRKVDLDGLPLSTDKRTVIRELGYGTNAKVMGAFKTRVWLAEHDSTGSVTSDEPFQQCWDTSAGQPGEQGLLTNFLGGRQGENSKNGSAEDWYASVMVEGAEKVFPGAKDQYVAGSAVRMHWPSHPFTLGSYACYAPGQWDFYGREGTPEGDGTLHFCGEHTSLEFQGYMEGGAESGALVASEILKALGRRADARLEALLQVKRTVPQPAMGERVEARKHRARLRALNAAWREMAARPPVSG